jgi:hypothetical protein
MLNGAPNVPEVPPGVLANTRNLKPEYLLVTVHVYEPLLEGFRHPIS